ncbi:WD40-repeat-containing domain protein [Cladochytrium replicatum]|nr:WD40-repeat-containing domain protein [Cladochytrium replicatum]
MSTENHGQDEIIEVPEGEAMEEEEWENDEAPEEVTEEQAPDDMFEDDSVQGFFGHRNDDGPQSVFVVAIHPNGTMVLTGGSDDSTYLWNIEDGETVFPTPRHGDSVVSVGFNADGHYAASGGMDGKIFVFRTSNGEIVNQLEGSAEVTWIDWHPSGNILLAGQSDGSVWMWTIPGAAVRTFFGHSGPVSCGGFDRDGKKIVTGSEDGSVYIWDPRTGTATHKITRDDARFAIGRVISLGFGNDSVLVGGDEGACRLIQLSSGRVLGALNDHTSCVEAIAFCESLPLAATAGVDDKICIWDLNSSRVRHTFKHSDTVTAILFHPIEHYLLLSASADMSVKMWDVRSGEMVKDWGGHQDMILDLAITPDGTKFVTTSDDGTALVFAI